MPVRILVVDDDRAVRESLRRSLSFNGYSVELAHDGVEALQMIASDRPDALVLDVMMPRLDGLEVWGVDFPTSGNALEVYVGYLRRKTEADGEPRLIHTVRGVGYVLRETPP